MNSGTYNLGIDIGSTTAKIVVLETNGAPVFSAYRRHNADAQATLRAILEEAHTQLGDIQLELLITGSAGLGVSEKFGLPFIQEVVSSAEVVRQRYPAVRTLIDIGGEDAKMIFFNEFNRPDIRMNGSCAGGTGAFIDEMATLLGIPITELHGLASQHDRIYPMASRCGVFAKTDLQNLIARQVPKENIAASVFHAVVLQTLATLARGREVSAPILFSGGPLTFLPVLKKAFLNVLDLGPDDVLDGESPELLPALGAALAPSASRLAISLPDLMDKLAQEQAASNSKTVRHQPLFETQQDFQDWEGQHEKHIVEKVAIAECRDTACFLGIDSGSTTTKIVLINPAGKVAFSHYAGNQGNAIAAVRTGLEAMRAACAEQGFEPVIAHSAVTGYGEDLISAAFGLDMGMVETLAHYRAAIAFDPQVSFILDIGGQDMKAIFIRDGVIQNVEINEACSSGCGSFLESFSRNMGYPVKEFAGLACSAALPFDLGTRCTVFMNSRVKQALREGAAIEDISAGLAYSVIKNALYKVLKITDPGVLGEHIVVQGGTFRNPAVLRAFETLLGRPVVRPDLAELMGAYGAALTARDEWERMEPEESQFIGFDDLAALDNYQRREIRCRGCENKCSVTRLIFPNGNHFFSGNRCEKIYTNGARAEQKGVNVPALKLDLLFKRVEQQPELEESRPVIGIPRVLNMFEDFPFWHALLTECGFEVRLSSASSSTQYQSGAAHIMSENLCYPGKLVGGHIMELIRAGVDRIFYPMVFFEKMEFEDADNSFNCPVVSGYPEVIRAAIDPLRNYGIPLDMPAITFSDQALLEKACTAYLRGLGIRRDVIKNAILKAHAAQAEYKESVISMGEQLIRESETSDKPLILLMGRPYHVDTLINHKIPDLLTEFGVNVITEDCLPMDGEKLDNRHVMTQWEYLNRYFYVARWAAQHQNVELVQLNSFGCGPDAFILDEIRAIMGEFGKSPTIIRIDEIESIGSTKLRLRSMLESRDLAARSTSRTRIPRQTTKTFQKEDRIRTLIVPDFSPFTSPPIVRPFKEEGYKIVQLPEADHASVETGLKYTNNEICYPGIITLGDLVKALASGEYDLARTAVGFSQTGGQCRATSYPAMIKKALVAAGFEGVPVVTLSTSTRNLNVQPGFEFDNKEYLFNASLGMMFTDALSSMYYSTVIREIEPGAAKAVADKYLDLFMEGVIPLSKASLLEYLDQAVTDFNAVETDQDAYPRVGIVGEIYVKYNAYSNNHVAQWLIQQGIEVVMPSFFEFFNAGMLTTDHNVRTNIKRRDIFWALTFLGQKLAGYYLREFDQVMQAYQRYHPHHAIQDVARHAQEILSLNHQYGEGWLIAGEIASLARQDVNNVLCLQPFGCIANHIVAKGVQKRLQEKYPLLNLLFLDADAGISEVNFFNRMHFFVNHARRAAFETVSVS